MRDNAGVPPLLRRCLAAGVARHHQVLEIARKLGGAGLELLVIDTESKYISSGLAEDVAEMVRSQKARSIISVLSGGNNLWRRPFRIRG